MHSELNQQTPFNTVVSLQVERNDYEGTYREGSGSDELGVFPPPPPPPDGKNCFCDKEYCCNINSDGEKAAGRYYRGEKGERGLRVSYSYDIGRDASCVLIYTY